jgi:hypothetical protein
MVYFKLQWKLSVLSNRLKRRSMVTGRVTGDGRAGPALNAAVDSQVPTSGGSGGWGHGLDGRDGSSNPPRTRFARAVLPVRAGSAPSDLPFIWDPPSIDPDRPPGEHRPDIDIKPGRKPEDPKPEDPKPDPKSSRQTKAQPGRGEIRRPSAPLEIPLSRGALGKFGGIGERLGAVGGLLSIPLIVAAAQQTKLGLKVDQAMTAFNVPDTSEGRAAALAYALYEVPEFHRSPWDIEEDDEKQRRLARVMMDYAWAHPQTFSAAHPPSGLPRDRDPAAVAEVEAVKAAFRRGEVEPEDPPPWRRAAISTR